MPVVKYFVFPSEQQVIKNDRSGIVTKFRVFMQSLVSDARKHAIKTVRVMLHFPVNIINMYLKSLSVVARGAAPRQFVAIPDVDGNKLQISSRVNNISAQSRNGLPVDANNNTGNIGYTYLIPTATYKLDVFTLFESGICMGCDVSFITDGRMWEMPSPIIRCGIYTTRNDSIEADYIFEIFARREPDDVAVTTGTNMCFVARFYDVANDKNIGFTTIAPTGRFTNGENRFRISVLFSREVLFSRRSIVTTPWTDMFSDIGCPIMIRVARLTPEKVWQQWTTESGLARQTYGLFEDRSEYSMFPLERDPILTEQGVFDYTLFGGGVVSMDSVVTSAFNSYHMADVKSYIHSSRLSTTRYFTGGSRELNYYYLTSIFAVTRISINEFLNSYDLWTRYPVSTNPGKTPVFPNAKELFAMSIVSSTVLNNPSATTEEEEQTFFLVATSPGSNAGVERMSANMNNDLYFPDKNILTLDVSTYDTMLSSVVRKRLDGDPYPTALVSTGTFENIFDRFASENTLSVNIVNPTSDGTVLTSPPTIEFEFFDDV